MGFFSGLAAEKYDRQYSDRVLVRRMTVYFHPQLLILSLIALLVIFIAVTSAVRPIIVSRGIDMLKDAQGQQEIYLISGIVLLVGFLGWLGNWARRRMTVKAVATVTLALATDAFRAATRHDLSFYDEHSSGKVVSRITSDTRDFGNLVVIVTDVVSQVFQSILLAVILVQTEWRLSLILFAIMPVVFVLAISYRTLARKITQQGMRAIANVNATIKETVSGIAIAKNFRQEGSIYEQFSEANRTSYKVNVRRGIILTVVFPVLSIIGGLMTALLVYSGGLTVIQGLVTAGSWYLFIQSLDYFLQPAMNLSSVWTQIQTGLAAAERVFALIDADPAVVQTGNEPAPVLRGQVEFKNLHFYYRSEEPVLNNFSLKIEPGETIALVGHTGAGKSSIARLINRFYEFQKGEILIDGKDIRSFNLESYRRQLGIVSQVPFLFSDTVLANIRYARPDASVPSIEQLARQIGNGEWLENLPHGLLTEVGERGTRLSMGQRQLVALMRVLVQHPAIFILDEATASVDPFTEWQIQQALTLILARSTSLLIAHRLSTVKSADRIIVLEKGRIIEEGNHERLLEVKGHYATLYNTYFRHQSLEYIENARQFSGESA
jgi:ATP-binding cassette, subfamily B, bacterial